MLETSPREETNIATNMQDDVSIDSVHHGRMILRTAVVNFISQIDYFLVEREQRALALDTKLCRLVSSALKALHASLSYQAEHGELSDNLVEYEFGTLIELLMFKVFDQKVNTARSTGGLFNKWLACKKWALRLSSLLVELLTSNQGAQVSVENGLVIRRLVKKLISILAGDLERPKSEGADKCDQLSKASVALAARLLNRLLSMDIFKLPEDQSSRLIDSLALPLACKYVTDNRLYLDARVYLAEFTLSYELASELQDDHSQTNSSLSLCARKSVHSATTCLLVRLIDLANREDRTKILASLGPFYQILDRAVSRAADPDKRDHSQCPVAPPADFNSRKLLVALLVIVRFEFESELSSQRCRQLFTKLVLLPILSAGSGYLRARLYWLMQNFYCNTASLLPEVLASLVVHAHDDLSVCDSVLQASAARFLQALLASGDLKSLAARHGHLKQADTYNRVKATLSERWQELLLDDAGGDERHEWHWITTSQLAIDGK